MTDARALRQRVARRICCVNGECWNPDKCHSWSFSGEASAAIDLVLEEAAKVAEAYPASTHGALATAPYAAAEQAADEIAVAIRAINHSS